MGEHLHIGEKPHDWPECGKSFHQASTQKTHMKFHSGEKPHICEECEKTFTRSDTLYKHQSNIHFTSAKNLDFVSEKVKPYSCELCLASFKTAWHLKRHKEKCQK